MIDKLLARLREVGREMETETKTRQRQKGGPRTSAYMDKGFFPHMNRGLQLNISSGRQ